MGKVGAGKYVAKYIRRLMPKASGAEKVASVPRRSLKIGLIGGLTSFFGFEWLTNSGLVRAVGGTLGINDTAASILVIFLVLSVVVILLFGLYKYVTRSRSGRRGGK